MLRAAEGLFGSGHPCTIPQQRHGNLNAGDADFKPTQGRSAQSFDRAEVRNFQRIDLIAIL